MRRGQIVVMALGLAMVVAGCSEPNPAYQGGPDLPDECRAGEETQTVLEGFERPDRLDIWVLVRDAGASVSYQEALANAMKPALLRWEEDYDMRVGVSTLGLDNGAGLAPVVDDIEGCEDNGRQVGQSGREGWEDVVACNIQQGSDGPRRARALDVIDEALIAEPSTLDGFRRDDARLLILVASNQDDCSADEFEDDPEVPSRDLCAWQSDDLRDVESVVEDLQETSMAAQGGISVAAISGPPTQVTYEEGESVRSVCQSTLGSSYPSPRLFEMAQRMGGDGHFESACVFDLDGAMGTIGDRLVSDDEVVLCTERPMAHEPLEVLAIDEDGEAEPMVVGEDLTIIGADRGCPDGGIAISARADRVPASVEMTYCAL